MDTRTHLRVQRHTMFRDLVGSRSMWMICGMLVGFFIGASLGKGFSPATFWIIVAFGLGGVLVQVLHLLHGDGQRNSAADRE